MKFYNVDRTKLRCPTCGKPMIPAVSIQGKACSYWMRCADYKCLTFLNTLVPMPHQHVVLEDPSHELGIFGAYGSGKTVIGYEYDQKHIMLTPDGETLVGANTLVQLENTIKKDFEGDFPLEFVEYYNKQKNKIHFINGHILYWRTLADEGDFRSYNLTRSHLLEASEIKYDSFVQIQARTRNMKATVPALDEHGAPIYDYDELTDSYKIRLLLDWRQSVAESNPDSGWIKFEFLDRSETVVLHKADVKFTLDPEVHKGRTTHIIPTRANYMLPPNYYEDLASGKPHWWVRRYLESDFSYSEGLVYPNHARQMIEDFPIPVHWQRVIGFDYGLNDNSHFIFGAIDWYGEHFADGKPAIFWFDEVVRNNLNVKGLATEYKQKYRKVIPTGSLYRTPAMDARSYSLRQKTDAKKTLGTLFAEEGCLFTPAQMNLDARLFKLNAFIDNGNAWFFVTGVSHLNEEMRTYKFPEKVLEQVKNAFKPIDKNNHGINACEFATMQLPLSLRPDMGNPPPRDPNRNKKKEKYNPFADLAMKNEEERFNGFGDIMRF